MYRAQGKTSGRHAHKHIAGLKPHRETHPTAQKRHTGFKVSAHRFQFSSFNMYFMGTDTLHIKFWITITDAMYDSIWDSAKGGPTVKGTLKFYCFIVLFMETC